MGGADFPGDQAPRIGATLELKKIIIFEIISFYRILQEILSKICIALSKTQNQFIEFGRDQKPNN